DIGNLVHAAIKELTDELIAEGVGFGSLEGEALRARVDRSFEAPLRRLREAGLFKSPSSALLVKLIREQAIALVEFLADAGRRMQSCPVIAVVTFGKAGESKGDALRIAMLDGSKVDVILPGQLD